jgi:DNA-binding PadR family transcriptional regulator
VEIQFCCPAKGEQELLSSDWKIEDGPPRRYYKLSRKGARLYADLTANWQSLVDCDIENAGDSRECREVLKHVRTPLQSRPI